MTVKYFEKEVVFSQRVKAKSLPAKVDGTVEFMICNDKKCLNPEPVKFQFELK
jgi:hypothetical protein